MDWIFDSLPLLIFAYFVLQALAGAVRGGRKRVGAPPSDEVQREQAERVAEMLRRLGVPVPEIEDPAPAEPVPAAPDLVGAASKPLLAPPRTSGRPAQATEGRDLEASTAFDRDAGFERESAFEREAAFERSGRPFAPAAAARVTPPAAARRTPPPPVATPRASTLLARMRQPDALREAFVMQMILDRRGAHRR